ncbi:MAG: class I SAM-dependent methyltransferase [Thermoplasmata archaeon]|nr:class I SAM-dependent methyltransferase [Thermoplasmata archaeon]
MSPPVGAAGVDPHAEATGPLPPDRSFVRGIFRGLAPRYDAVLHTYTLAQDLRWKHVLVERLAPVRGERSLDLACGTGLLLERCARLLGPDAAVGADINRSMLLELARRAGPHCVLQADAQRLPLASGTFDVVTAGYLLKYVDLDRFFREVARILRPGGRFGGYDFSRPLPGTVWGTAYAVYLHHVLPVLGGAITRLPVEAEALFRFLPRIAETSGWEARAPAALRRAGFEGTETSPSMGGAITWLWSRKPLA